jgi:hypothetical protein
MKTHLNIIITSTPGSPHWSLSRRFPHQNPVHSTPLTLPRYMTTPSHFSRFYHQHNIGRGLQIMKLLIIYQNNYVPQMKTCKIQFSLLLY